MVATLSVEIVEQRKIARVLMKFIAKKTSTKRS